MAGSMKTVSETYVRTLVVGFAVASLMLSGSAFAGIGAPEIDPGMATGGLAVLGVGIVLLIERYRARS
jgi:hypothetical protein